MREKHIVMKHILMQSFVSPKPPSPCSPPPPPPNPPLPNPSKPLLTHLLILPSYPQASSVFFIVLIVCQWGHLISIRRRSPYFSDAIMGVSAEETTGGAAGGASSSKNSVGYKPTSLCTRLYNELLDSTPR